jgi:prophage tail gpP-like protein
MGLVLICNIEIGAYRFRQVNEVEIRKSWRELSGKARIALPMKNNLQNIVKPGDPVKITLGYLGVYEGEEFQGYVSRVSPNYPLSVECEDNAYLLKKTNLSKSWTDTTLNEIVSYIIDQVKQKFPAANISSNASIPSVAFTNFRLANENAAQALTKLKEEYGLASFFQGSVLFVGLANQINTGKVVKHSFSWNIIQAESDLVFRKADEVSLKVKIYGITRDNKKIETDETIGDEDGEQRTIYVYNVTDKEALKKQAIDQLNRMKFDGYDGHFSTFLVPYAEPLMATQLQDPNYDESRGGTFLIDTVITTFGEDGARRRIEPGRRLSV